MYFVLVALTMFILPVASIAIDYAVAHAPLIILLGKWFVFWSVGVRLAVAGLRQFLQPTFTARHIFHMPGDEALPIIRELGVANAATGIVGLASLAAPTFVLPVAISAGIFYGIAGVRHATEKGRSVNENVAMVSDLFISVVLAGFVLLTAAGIAGAV